MYKQDNEIISKYFPDLDNKKCRQFEQLGFLYAKWNEKINLISRKDIQHLYLHHILHSLSIAQVISFKAGTTVLDVGTGGGFPGIPLAILFPDTNFYLIDSIEKKIRVVKDIASALHLKNISSEKIRAEQVKEKYDFIISRAVTRLPVFYEWIKENIKEQSRHPCKNGILYLKGDNIEEEISMLKKDCHIFPLKDYFEESFFAHKVLVHIPF